MLGVSLAACGDSAATTTGTGGAATTSTTGSSPTTAVGTSTGTGSGTSSSTGTGTGGGAPADYDCTAPTGTVPTLGAKVVVNGLSEPVQVKAAPDDPDRLYVVQKSGQIVIVENGVLLPTPFLDISSKVIDSGEEGLLGLAFHPNYKQNGRFFVHYSSTNAGKNTVEEYHRSAADLHVADATPTQLVLQHTTAEANHNGGAVEFGKDGFLYISMGDGGNQGDPECDAQLSMGGEAPQEPENLLGKITRLDVDAAPTAAGYPAAAGNPSGMKAYHKGFRNPWRMSFDVCTGDLFIGDVGQNTYEEVDQIKQADGAVDAGWPYREGAHDYTTPATCPAKPATLFEPITDYQHQMGRCSITGGYVYRSSTIPALRGAYFYADYCTGEIFYIFPGQTPVKTSASSITQISAMGQDGRGNVYFVGIATGDLYEIAAP